MHPETGDRVRLSIDGEPDDVGTVRRTGTDPHGGPYAIVDWPHESTVVSLDALDIVDRAAHNRR